MRGALIIGLMVLALGGIFYFFVLRTGPEFSITELAPPTTTQKVVPTTIPSLDESIPVGRSAGVWVQSLDAKTHRIVNEFRSDDVVPRSDGSVDVMRPQARFYGSNGGIVTLEGSQGHVFYTQAGARDDAKSLGTSTPTSGELKDVTIRFFEKSLEEEPVILVTVPAVRFDANSNRISTVDCVVDGRGYAAEQVPVTMRGRDFDFDGQGLSVAWNDREGMLDQLEILHGERLLVRDVSKFIGDRVVAAEPRPTQRRPAGVSPAHAMAGIVMVQDLAVRSDEAKDLYHATFDREVRILKQGREIASGDLMRCVIPLGKTESGAQRRDPDARHPATRREARPRPDNAARPATSPATAPATQPVPLEIRWTGKLTVRPVRVVPEAPRTPMVELTGSPARVEENGTSATGRTIHVEPDAGRVRIEPGGQVRAIEIKDATGAELRSRSPLVIDESQGLAMIEGGGALNVPPGAQQESPLALSWSQKLTLALGKGGSASLQRILIEGDAKVDSDQLAMNCGSLELGFDAPSEAGPARTGDSRFAMPSPDLSLLRRVHARGDAICRVGTAQAQRTLSAQDIQLGFEGAQDDALLNSILCDGKVSLVDAGGMNLDAGALSVQTKPLSLSKPQQDDEADFFSLVTGFSAERDVRITRQDGSSVSGEEVELVGEGPAQRLLVKGSPAALSSPKGSLRGDQIELDPATGDIRVQGKGNFAGANPDRPGTSVAIGWLESMNVVGKTGICQFVGSVDITGRDEKGSRLFAQARHGTLQFRTVTAATQPQANGLAGLQFDSIQSLTLDGSVGLSVQTSDERSSSIESERLDVDLEKGLLSLPQRGRMQLIDGRSKQDRGKSKLGPGALAMQWNDRLDWDMRDGELKLLGGVRVGFELEGNEDRVRILCNQLTGTLTPLETQNGFDQLTPQVDLQTLHAQGDVAVRSKDASFDAANLMYDLRTQIATAHGTETRPVEVIDSQGTSRIGFSSITWNLETGQMESRDITGEIRR